MISATRVIYQRGIAGGIRAEVNLRFRGRAQAHRAHHEPTKGAGVRTPRRQCGESRC